MRGVFDSADRLASSCALWHSANIAKYLDYAAIISINSFHDISSTLSMTWECISKAWNREIDAKQLNLESQHTHSCANETANLKMCFSQCVLWTFLHWACSMSNIFSYILARSLISKPLESLIYLLPNGATNSILLFYNVHTTHFVRTWQHVS